MARLVEQIWDYIIFGSFNDPAVSLMNENHG